MERYRGDVVAIATILIGGIIGINVAVQVTEALPLKPAPGVLYIPMVECECVVEQATVDYYRGDPGGPILPSLLPE